VIIADMPSSTVAAGKAATVGCAFQAHCARFNGAAAPSGGLGLEVLINFGA
jgi:hypothetical protein